MLKKILLSIIVTLFLSSLSLAADLQKTVTFSWQQDNESLAVMVGGGGWTLYTGNTPGGPYTPALDDTGKPIFIPYDGNPESSYTSNQTLLVTGTVGSSVTKYFVLTSKSKDNSIESAYSNEAALQLTIPIGIPFSFTVKINQ